MKSSIKDRWIKNILFVTISILFVFSCIIVYSFYARYNNAAELAIRARISKSVDTFFTTYNVGDDKTFEVGADEFVKNFLYGNTMEVWVLDENGKMVASSSGFRITSSGSFDDYTEALDSDDNIGIKRLRLDSGEPVMAATYILRDSSGDNYGAVRYLMSMQEMYRQLAMISLLVFLSFVLIVLLITISGMYFVSSIINPVAEICRTTGEIAKGDFSVRIAHDYYDDEIGELCVSINNMAKQLSEIDKMKNDFISTVSHEIRTPLTAIKGWGETLQNFTSDEELTKKGLGVIISETTRLSSMVEELLDFSRVQNNSITLVKEKVILNDVINNVYLTYKQKAENDGIELLLSIPEESIYLDCDPNKINQVFINILDNAIKYSQKGCKVEIFLERIEKYVKIVFRDNGCGISQEDLLHVKEKFYKANHTVRGTGIGLAVADEIIKKHSGELKISSELSVGTTVEIILPLDKKED